MLWLLCSVAGMYLDKLANGENEKYMYGRNVYSEEDVKEYFYSHKEEFNQIAELITSKCKFGNENQLETGITVCRKVEFFNRHKYVIEEYQYMVEANTGGGKINEYKSDYFTKDEIEILNVLTDHYCNIISMDMTHMGVKKSLPYLRFILRSCNFGITQQLVYMPDGSMYYDDAGRIVELGENWYYHTNR